MKRLTSILLALVMVISLTACGSTADTEKEETTSGAAEEVMEETAGETEAEEAQAESSEGEKGTIKIGLSIAGQCRILYVCMKVSLPLRKSRDGKLFLLTAV